MLVLRSFEAYLEEKEAIAYYTGSPNMLAAAQNLVLDLSFLLGDMFLV